MGVQDKAIPSSQTKSGKHHLGIFIKENHESCCSFALTLTRHVYENRGIL
jgi:hypothetical protein